MSEENKVEENEDVLSAENALKNVFSILVPPESIKFFSIFGKEYERPSVVGARTQIKILRILDELPSDVSLSFSGTAANIVSSIIELASNEDVLTALSKAMSLAHPSVVKDAIKDAKEQKYSYDKEHPVLDLFSVEEIVASIVPLFLRLAQRGGQAMNLLGRVSF